MPSVVLRQVNSRAEWWHWFDKNVMWIQQYPFSTDAGGTSRRRQLRPRRAEYDTEAEYVKASVFSDRKCHGGGCRNEPGGCVFVSVCVPTYVPTWLVWCVDL